MACRLDGAPATIGAAPRYSATHPRKPLFRHFNAPLEKSFTVVNWDQRVAGKSFDRKIPKTSMTVEQFIADLDDLVTAVFKRLGKNKVTIFGHSWGSALGVPYAARFPEKVAAYVGSGQIGDWPAGELLSYAFVLAKSERRNNRKALKELRAIGPPLYTAKKLWVERTWLDRVEGHPGGMSLWKFGRVVLAVRNRRSSICPTFCAAFPSLSTLCGQKCWR